MSEHQLEGLHVQLGQPRQVRALAGYQWFPGIHRFPTGNLLLTAILTADTHDNLANAYWVSTSSDNGITWSRFYDVAGWGGGPIPRVVQNDGSLAGPDFYLWPDPPGQARTFSSHFERFEEDGHRFVREPFAVRVEGLPHDVHVHGDERGGKDWPGAFIFYGSYVDLGDEVITATHLTFAGETKYTQVALASSDRGRTWTYRATIADSDSAGDVTEGPNESCVVALETGELMCVMRVGRRDRAIHEYDYLARSYSSDNGHTWSTIDRLPIRGVAPCLRRLSSGILMLATGRPGLDLWFSTDARGEHWQTIDLLAHHNDSLGSEHQIRRGGGTHHKELPDQTTAYTEFVEIAPGRILLTYDRIPFGWEPVPINSEERNRVYVIEVDVTPR